MFEAGFCLEAGMLLLWRSRFVGTSVAVAHQLTHFLYTNNEKKKRRAAYPLLVLVRL
jgi:hypothetical protein